MFRFHLLNPIVLSRSNYFDLEKRISDIEKLSARLNEMSKSYTTFIEDCIYDMKILKENGWEIILEKNGDLFAENKSLSEAIFTQADFSRLVEALKLRGVYGFHYVPEDELILNSKDMSDLGDVLDDVK